MFVDLAGSERLKDHDQNRRETAKINKSLFCLGKVIASLSTSTSHHAVHIAYRDSLLTKLLKDGLSGHALTLMITCCSPCNLHQEETLNTLLYAQKAKGIVYDTSLDETAARSRTELSVLREEVKHLRKQNSDLHHRLKSNDTEFLMSHSFDDAVARDRTTQRGSHPSLSQRREAVLNNIDDPPPLQPSIDGTGSGFVTAAASDNVLREIEALKAKMRRLERQFRDRPVDLDPTSDPNAFVRSGDCTMGRGTRNGGIIVTHPDVSRLMFE